MSPSLCKFLISIRHILWGGGQKGPRGDQAITIPEAPRIWEGIRTSFLLAEILRNLPPTTAPDWHRRCHQCHELAVLCSQSLKGAVLTGSRDSGCTLGILTDPLGCSCPPGRGIAKKGAHTTPPPTPPCSSLLWCVTEAPVSVPVPSWDGPGRPNSSGLMLMSVFPRHLSERGRVPVRAGRGTGHLPSCHHGRLSP